MRVAVQVREPTSWNDHGLRLVTPDGRGIVLMFPKANGHGRLTADESRAISEAIAAALPDGIEIPDRDDGWKFETPSHVRISQGGSASTDGVPRVRNSSALPADIPRTEHGEVIVPPRLKEETPDYKRRRRALRDLRKKEAEAKAAARR